MLKNSQRFLATAAAVQSAPIMANKSSSVNAASKSAPAKPIAIRKQTAPSRLSLFYKGPMGIFGMLSRAKVLLTKEQTAIVNGRPPTWNDYLERRQLGRDFRLTCLYYGPLAGLSVLNNWVWLLLVPFAPPAAWIALQSERRLLPSFTWLNDDGNGDNKSNVVKGRALPPKNPDMKAANALISAIKQRLPNGFVMGTLEPASPDIDRQLLRESYSIYRQVLSQQLAESVPLSALDAREMRALMRSMDLAGWPVFLNWRPLKALGAWRLSNEMDRILYEDRHLDSDKNETISMEDAHELLSRRVGLPIELIRKLKDETLVQMLTQYLRFTAALHQQNREFKQQGGGLVEMAANQKRQQYATGKLQGIPSFAVAKGVLSLALARSQLAVYSQHLLLKQSPVK